MLRRTLPTILFTLFALMVIACDYFLAMLLGYVKDKKTFEVSFENQTSAMMDDEVGSLINLVTKLDFNFANIFYSLFRS